MTTRPRKIGPWVVGFIGMPSVTMFVAAKRSGVRAIVSFGRPRWRPWGRYWLGISTTLISDTGSRRKTWNAPFLRRP